MKKLGLILLTLLMLVGCGSKTDDVDTLELLNKALNNTNYKDEGAYELKLTFATKDEDNAMTLDLDGLFRQSGKFDLDALRAQDFSNLEMELTGSVDIPSFGTKMDLGFYMNDGVVYAELLGSKIKIDLRDFADEINEALEDMSEAEMKPTVTVLTSEDMKHLVVTKEADYIRYTLPKEEFDKIVSEGRAALAEEYFPGEALETFESLTEFSLYVDVNLDGSIREFGAQVVGDLEGSDVDFLFTITSKSLKDARKITFPDFKDYIDMGAMGL